MQPQKRQNDLCFQGKPFNITLIQVYAPTSNAEEAEAEQFYEHFRTNTQKRCPFHYRGLECKVGSQKTPEVTGRFGFGIWKQCLPKY